METTNDKPADAVETPFALEIQEDVAEVEEVDNRTQEEIDYDNRMFAIEMADTGEEIVDLMEVGDMLSMGWSQGSLCKYGEDCFGGCGFIGGRAEAIHYLDHVA